MACDHCSWHLATNAIGPPPSLVLPNDSESRGLNLRRLSPPRSCLEPQVLIVYSSYPMSRGRFRGSRACVLSELELAKLFSPWLRAIPQHQAKRSQTDSCITNCQLSRKARESGSHFKPPKRRFHFNHLKKPFRSHRHRRSTTVVLNRSQRYHQHITTVSIVWFV